MRGASLMLGFGLLIAGLAGGAGCGDEAAVLDALEMPEEQALRGELGDPQAVEQAPAPADLVWTATPAMSDARRNHAAVLLGDGRVLVIGGHKGISPPNHLLASSEIYNPATNAWTPAGLMSKGRRDHPAVLLGNGKVLVAGGAEPLAGGGEAISAVADIYDPLANTWTPAASMPAFRVHHTATLLGAGDVLIVGGWSSGGNPSKGAERYNVAGNSWTPAASLSTEHSDHTATLLQSGKVLVAGGQSLAGITASAEVYDPAANTWTPTSPMTAPRTDHAAVLLAGGDVLVVGGSGLKSAERFNPASNTWTAVASMKSIRKWHTATLLVNGSVLVAGGSDGLLLSSAEIYDPVSDTWTSLGPMSQGHASHTATRLNNGRVLIAGGGISSATPSVDLFGLLPVGDSCSAAVECSSGFCVDGVCCSSACSATCQACSFAKKGAGFDGVCDSIVAGKDPDNECAAESQSTCGLTGDCDGGTACQKYPAGAVCEPASCSGTTLHKADLCDGFGACVGGGVQECAPNLCSGGECQWGCIDDTACAPDAFCAFCGPVLDVIVPCCTFKLPDGSPCAAPNECLSGNCIDDVCCDSACDGLCSACTAAKKGAGDDGVCGAIPAAQDPEDDCPDQESTTCGLDGFCDGEGACRRYAAGTLCAEGSCSGTIADPAGFCDGNGACIDAEPKDCSPFSCLSGVCPTICTSDIHCSPGTYCDAPLCLPKKAAGAACAGESQCLTGSCADGVCCEGACGAGGAGGAGGAKPAYPPERSPDVSFYSCAASSRPSRSLLPPLLVFGGLLFLASRARSRSLRRSAASPP
jgi:N-acetylneuraminic acid mutarotase